MKVLFFIIAIAAVSALSAQNLNAPWVKPLTPKPRINSLERPKSHMFGQPQLKLIPHARLIQTLSNGNKVYALPNSNMPCVVPDLSQYNYNMPVVKPHIAHTMPNAGLPPYNLPPMTQQQFNKLLEMPNHPQVIFK